MVFDVSKIIGSDDFTRKSEEDRELYLKDGRVFFVSRPNTIEVRCDSKLSRLLQEKYETVMESRYFGFGGIEIVLADQLTPDELIDLIRLSYNLTTGDD